MVDGVTKFEAKKHAWRQTQDGIVVSFVIHPSDIDAALAVAPLGTRFAIGIVELKDGVEANGSQAQTRTPSNVPAPPREWLEMSAVQQAGIRCNEARFQLFLGAADGKDAARKVREHCGVQSRRDILPGTAAAHEWANLDRDYRAWMTSQQFGDAVRP